MHPVLSAFSPVRNLKQLFIRPPGNFPVLDGFRALSMLMILVFHTFGVYGLFHPDIEVMDLVEESGLLWSWVWNADKSVDIFFVISGFLISGILLRQIDRDGKIHMWQFYSRRFLRLSPAYWLVIALYVAIGVYVVDDKARELMKLENLWANVLYVNNFLPYKEQAMNWTWTLAIEEQFYLVYPLLLVFVMRFPNPERWLWGLLGLSFVIRFVVIMTDERIRTTPLSMLILDPDFQAHYFSVLYDNLYTRYGALLCGCLGAFYYFHHEAALKRFLNTPLGHLLGWLSLAVMLFMMILPVASRSLDEYSVGNIVYQTFGRNLFSGALTYLILLCVEKSYMSRVLNLIFASRFWYPLAQLSYSMYLLHVLAIMAVVPLGVRSFIAFPEVYPFDHWEAMWILTAVATVLTILGATIIYLLVERPIMNLRK
ncbi:MAG: acyltransferase [Gammaproteobacteria bacterium]